MSILCDWQIRKLCEEGMINPFEPDLVNPASLDVRVGDTAILEWETGQEPINLVEYPVDDPFWLNPGDCVLVGTLEIFNIPNHLAAQFRLKSSRGREWYDNMDAGFVDPGFYGALTMEIKNAHPFNKLPLYPGLKMGQLTFYLLARTPERSYAQTGRYNGQQGAFGSLG